MCLPHPFDGLCGAFLGANHTPLAVVVVCAGETLIVNSDTGVGASGNTDEALGAEVIVPDGFEYAPIAGLSHRGISYGTYRGAGNHGGTFGRDA